LRTPWAQGHPLLPHLRATIAIDPSTSGPACRICRSSTARWASNSSVDFVVM
jgi:hypothetical protein